MSTEDPDDPDDSEEVDDPEDQEAEDDDLRYFVRIGQTDLDGTKSVERALTEMNGIGHRAARLLARKAGVDRREIFGALDDETIEDIVSHVEDFAAETPDWMANHRREYFSGETTHEIGNDLAMTRRHDINRMKMISSYKGVRHKRGQKVRGQRTKSTGRTEGTVGVNVEAIQEEAEAEEEGAGGRVGEL